LLPWRSPLERPWPVAVPAFQTRKRRLNIASVAAAAAGGTQPLAAATSLHLPWRAGQVPVALAQSGQFLAVAQCQARVPMRSVRAVMVQANWRSRARPHLSQQQRPLLGRHRPSLVSNLRKSTSHRLLNPHHWIGRTRYRPAAVEAATTPESTQWILRIHQRSFLTTSSRIRWSRSLCSKSRPSSKCSKSISLTFLLRLRV